MSWKGFQKSVVRAPQTVKAKFNVGEVSKDAIYLDSERRFQDLETETKKLHDESKKYSEAINTMLSHQIEFSKACAEIYQPISGRVSDPDSFIQEGNPEGIRACEEYESIVRDLQETLAPELEMIESRVIKPADELMEIIKQVRKVAGKRDHKQLDYDRHRTALKKLQDKKDKTLKDEKALYKAENDVEAATQDFNYFNELLKTELPQLFQLEREFIKPLFQSFYYMQLNVFYTLHERMQNIDIGYFDLTKDIEEGYEASRGEIKDDVEKLSIVKFKTTGGRRPGAPKYGNKPLAIEAGSSTGSKYESKYGKLPAPAVQAQIEAPPPAYSANGALSPSNDSKAAPYSPASSVTPYSPASTLTPPVSAGLFNAAKSKGPAPPPPKPKPAGLKGHVVKVTVTALYDYEAQAEGDLSFSTGEVIEIITKTDNVNEWWTGKIGPRTGQFPGNYVQLNH
ncbi:hypothetical protein EG328_000195 [Venturia inaequalis]|nr:hypothetical protein EG328_000195 [Venturia inaequalis]KAE9990207.1 hypothetical protein EG327_001678 [Venturia inaequalis]